MGVRLRDTLPSHGWPDLTDFETRGAPSIVIVWSWLKLRAARCLRRYRRSVCQALQLHSSAVPRGTGPPPHCPEENLLALLTTPLELLFSHRATMLTMHGNAKIQQWHENTVYDSWKYPSNIGSCRSLLSRTTPYTWRMSLGNRDVKYCRNPAGNDPK